MSDSNVTPDATPVVNTAQLDVFEFDRPDPKQIARDRIAALTASGKNPYAKVIQLSYVTGFAIPTVKNLATKGGYSRKDGTFVNVRTAKIAEDGSLRISALDFFNWVLDDAKVERGGGERSTVTMVVKVPRAKMDEFNKALTTMGLEAKSAKELAKNRKPRAPKPEVATPVEATPAA